MIGLQVRWLDGRSRVNRLDDHPDAVWFCHQCAFIGSYSEADAHLVTQRAHVLSPWKTKTGRIVTNAEMDRWVEEAERGYPVEQMQRVTPMTAQPENFLDGPADSDAQSGSAVEDQTVRPSHAQHDTQVEVAGADLN